MSTLTVGHRRDGDWSGVEERLRLKSKRDGDWSELLSRRWRRRLKLSIEQELCLNTEYRLKTGKITDWNQWLWRLKTGKYLLEISVFDGSLIGDDQLALEIHRRRRDRNLRWETLTEVAKRDGDGDGSREERRIRRLKLRREMETEVRERRRQSWSRDEI